MTGTDSEKKVELKPCPLPWCGSEDVGVIRFEKGKEVEHAVQCYVCGTISPATEYQDHAIEIWNKRADQ